MKKHLLGLLCLWNIQLFCCLNEASLNNLVDTYPSWLKNLTAHQFAVLKKRMLKCYDGALFIANRTNFQDHEADIYTDACDELKECEKKLGSFLVASFLVGNYIDMKTKKRTQSYWLYILLRNRFLLVQEQKVSEKFVHYNSVITQFVEELGSIVPPTFTSAEEIVNYHNKELDIKRKIVHKRKRALDIHNQSVEEQLTMRMKELGLL